MRERRAINDGAWKLKIIGNYQLACWCIVSFVSHFRVKCNNLKKTNTATVITDVYLTTFVTLQPD